MGKIIIMICTNTIPLPRPGAVLILKENLRKIDINMKLLLQEKGIYLLLEDVADIIDF